jgi:hypothetical protein
MNFGTSVHKLFIISRRALSYNSSAVALYAVRMSCALPLILGPRCLGSSLRPENRGDM